MLSQNGQHSRQHSQSALPTDLSSAGFDSANYFPGIDSTAAAKQISSPNDRARINNARQPGFVTGSPYIGGGLAPQHPGNAIPGANREYPVPSMIGLNQPNFQSPNPPQHFNPNTIPPYLDGSAPNPNVAGRPPPPNQMNPQLVTRQRQFLASLANLMSRRGTPLPPALTGVPSAYDPSNTMWKSIEPSPGMLGSFRLAGKDIDLFKLRVTVYQAGGGAKLSAQNTWHTILPFFDLPEHIPTGQGGSASVAATLAKYYSAILHPFEEAYKQNSQIQQQQMKSMGRPPQPFPGPQQARPPQPPGSNLQPQTNFPPQSGQMHGSGAAHAIGLTNVTNAAGQVVDSPQTGPFQYPLHPTGSSQGPQQQITSPMKTQHMGQGVPQPVTPSSSLELLGSVSTPRADKSALDQDPHAYKRKLDGEDEEGKRSRQKTDTPERAMSSIPSGSERGSAPPTSTSPSKASIPPSAPARPRTQPSRRKIEYVPIARELDTHGGRNLDFIEEEMSRITHRRLVRDINDWGVVDIEAVTMSIRSRLSTELSYALTTLTLLSTMRGQAQGSGFPIVQCPDLVDELLDLLEDEAFEDEDAFDSPTADDIRIPTHRQLVRITREEGTQPFASLERLQGSKDPSLGPRQRPANIVLIVLNIIRNLSIIPDNVPHLAKHERLLDVLLRFCDVARSDKGGDPLPACNALSLADLIAVRKDVLYLLAAVAPCIHLSTSLTNVTRRIANRAFELISSYLIESSEAISPIACAQIAGIPLSGHLKPPLFADVALEAFTRLSLPDANRQVFSKVIPQAWIWNLLEALVHRLPVMDADFQLVVRDQWLSYLEKLVMSIYSLCFLAPPELKQRIKSDRKLGFTRVMLRMIQKFLMHPITENRMWFMVSARRAIETMKVVDDGEDSFDTSETAVPTMSFGMGWGDVGDNGVEKGTGLLGGHRGLAWDLLMMVGEDSVMFTELESLARVD